MNLKKKFYSVLSLLMALCLSIQVLPGQAHALGKECTLTTCQCVSCGWKFIYLLPTETQHSTYVACTNCTATFWHGNEAHTFFGDTCTLCGYVQIPSCSHGSYTYNCEYYNGTCHYVSKVCRYCGEEVDYFRENHNLQNSFSQYSSIYHTYESCCADCNETVDSYREAHRWSYDYRTYSSTEHRVDMTCRDCNYSTTDYEYHSDSNGDGRCDNCGESLSVTVTWNAGKNGGTVNGSSSATTSAISGSIASTPGYTPVKTGHSFKGWYIFAGR